MTPENNPKPDRRPGPAVRLAPAPAPQARGKKGRSPVLTNIKMFIAGASLATTMRRWALLAQHDALQARVIVEPAPIGEYAAPEAAAEAPVMPTALSQALAAQRTATAEATVSVAEPPASTATSASTTESQAATATDTPQATSTPEATST